MIIDVQKINRLIEKYHLQHIDIQKCLEMTKDELLNKFLTLTDLYPWEIDDDEPEPEPEPEPGPKYPKVISNFMYFNESYNDATGYPIWDALIPSQTPTPCAVYQEDGAPCIPYTLGEGWTNPNHGITINTNWNWSAMLDANPDPPTMLNNAGYNWDALAAEAGRTQVILTSTVFGELISITIEGPSFSIPISLDWENRCIHAVATKGSEPPAE